MAKVGEVGILIKSMHDSPFPFIVGILIMIEHGLILSWMVK